MCTRLNLSAVELATEGSELMVSMLLLKRIVVDLMVLVWSIRVDPLRIPKADLLCLAQGSGDSAQGYSMDWKDVGPSSSLMVDTTRLVDEAAWSSDEEFKLETLRTLWLAGYFAAQSRCMLNERPH